MSHTVYIEYGGFFDLTPYVVMAESYFISKTDGNPGEAYLRIKDENHEFAAPYYDPEASGDAGTPGMIVPGFFRTGGSLALYIDSELEWRGWVMAVSATYAFPVDRTQDPQLTPRFWLLNGTDLNIAFQRRYLFDQAHPENANGLPLFPAGTSDYDVITTFLAGYVDLTGTLVDYELFDNIQTIGSPGIEDDFQIGSVGEPFATLFTDICGQTGGVFYISPDGRINYVDDETVTAPWHLTDRPIWPDELGYREITIDSKGDALANDALVWGAGRGSADPVFGRHQDEDSIDEHGRFQWGDQFVGAWRQATVNKRARTYVEGSTLHRRGHKDDQTFISCAVWEPGIRPAMVVDFENVVHGFTDAIPVREVRISFPTKFDPRWDLKLSHSIDVPFARVDPWDPLNPGSSPPDPPPVVTVQGGPIDEFDREEDQIWGTATGGGIWLQTDEFVFEPGDIFSPGTGPVEGISVGLIDPGIGRGQGFAGGLDSPVSINGILTHSGSTPITIFMRIRAASGIPGGYDPPLIGVSLIPSLVYDGDLVDGHALTYVPGMGGSFSPISMVQFDDAIPADYLEWHLFTAEFTGSSYRAKVWIESGEEPDWMTDVEIDLPGSFEALSLERYFYSNGGFIEVDWIRQESMLPALILGNPTETPTKIDGVYHTQYPYIAGTLRVFSNGTEIFEFTESDPGNGEFTIPEASDVGVITCTYTIYNYFDPEGGGDGDWRFPVQGYVTQEFGCTGFYLEPPRGDCPHFHDGIDIANRQGTPMYAPTNGTVQYVGWNPADSTDPAFIISILADVGGYRTGMAHLVPQYVVSAGQHVVKGQLVGYMGNTGNSTGPHCHWEVYLGATPINPRSLL